MPGPYKVEKEIDLMEHEVGQPHWLSPQARFPHVALKLRAKYRALHKARRLMAQINRQLDKAGAKTMKDEK